MDYATVQDLIARFGERELIELTDPEDLEQVKEAKVNTVLGDAHAFVDGYVGKVYRLPLPGCTKPAPMPGNANAVQMVAPPLLTRMVCDVARYYLYDDLAPESEVYRRYKQATTELQAIADGKAQLMCPWGGQPGQSADSGPAAGETYHAFAPRQIGRDVDGSYR